MNYLINRQRGAVSLFIVLFTSLLFAIITVSFIQIVVRNQQQATNNDVSQSAYDSALAGVEDAKRVLLIDQACRSNVGSYTAATCTNVRSALSPASGSDTTSCSVLSDSGIAPQSSDANGQNKETKLQTSISDTNTLDQSYTCVKLTVNTDDYLNQLNQDQTTVVPLRGVTQFSSVRISWFSGADLSGSSSAAVSLPPSGSVLPRAGNWQKTTPALLRTQLIQAGTSFNLNDFNIDANGPGSNTNTLFLSPTSAGLTSTLFSSDVRGDAGSTKPTPVRCKSDITGGGYACELRIDLPDPVSGSSTNRTAFLNMTALYNQAHFKLQLLSAAGDVVKFEGVQPMVDSTGRANDLFRRVQSRVELRGDFAFPDAELDLAGSLCKDLSVTDRPDDYANACASTP